MGKGNSSGNAIKIILLALLAAAVVIVGILAFTDLDGGGDPPQPSRTPGQAGGQAAGPEDVAEATPEPTPTPAPTPFFHTPEADASALPSSFGYRRELELNGERVESYTGAQNISFGPGEAYTDLEGVLTFRGNNYRDSASYGTADVSAKTLTLKWTVKTGSMPKGISGDGSWTGSGWVGQPLIVRWPENTKRIMNLYEDAKNKPGLVEVILATMDGYVYFLDLDTGKPTRDKLKINMPFKGAGSLDPRGYPLLYLGSGDGYNDDKQDTRAMVYSLIDGKRLYEFGKRKDSFAIRSWHAYDSAPLVDAKTDTLFYPGENGILYRVKLNTNYDEAAGTISVDPDEMLKYRYNADRYRDSKYYLGYEDSAVVWNEYMYLTDNGGLMQCINLNTMDIVWTQDTWDDTNGTPALEVVEEDHTAYLYLGTSLRINANSKSTGDVAFFKIDAATGKIIWEDVRSVATVKGVSGGVQASAVLGKKSIDDLVIVPYARYPSDKSGRGALVALDKATGEERWRYSSDYSWSSPVAVYDAAGNAYIVHANSDSSVFLLDGKTGELLDALTFEERNNFEASPAVFENTIVIGSRLGRIYGITIN